MRRLVNYSIWLLAALLPLQVARAEDCHEAYTECMADARSTSDSCLEGCERRDYDCRRDCRTTRREETHQCFEQSAACRGARGRILRQPSPAPYYPGVIYPAPYPNPSMPVPSGPVSPGPMVGQRPLPAPPVAPSGPCPSNRYELSGGKRVYKPVPPGGC